MNGLLLPSSYPKKMRESTGPKLHNVEGPCNVIVNTFSRLSRQDDTSALVGKKVITDEDSALASHSLFDDKEIFD